MATPIELTDETFESEVAKDRVTVVDCWAPWCGPCRMMAPVVDELAKDYAGKAEYQIMSIPTLLVFKNGKLVDRITGAMPRGMLEPRIVKHLGS